MSNCHEEQRPVAEFMRESIVGYFVVRVRCRRKNVHVRYLIS